MVIIIFIMFVIIIIRIILIIIVINVMKCLWCCHHDKVIAHAVYLMNVEQSQQTWAMSVF